VAHGTAAARRDGPGPGLQPLFQPRSIAVVGASPSPGKAGNSLMRSLAPFAGPIYPVNPRAREIAGYPCTPTVGEIADPPDLAILTVPAAAVPAAIEDCGRAGVRAAVVCAGGFAESPAGAPLQELAVRTARRYGLRLLGPNTSGFVSPADGTFATFVRSASGLLPGPVSIVARSGGVNLATCFLASNSGTGIRFGVGLGNGADVSFSEVLDFMADDDATTAVGLHLEGIADGRLLCDAITRLARRKPVVALKVGRGPVDDFAQSHTGALLGDYELAVAALTQSGAVVVEDLGELVDALRTLSARRLPPRPVPGVAIVTAQAGPGLIMADELSTAGVVMPELAESTIKAVSELLPPLTWIRNPVDTGRPSGTFPQLLACVAQDPRIDVIAVYALDEPDALRPAEAVAESGVLATTPVVFGTSGPAQGIAASDASLARLGVATFAEPRRAARATRALAADAQASWRLSEDAPQREQLTGPPVTQTLDEHQAKELMETLGVRTTRRRLCRDRAEALRAFSELGPPVVAKIVSPQVLHKSDVGGVRPNLRTRDQLTAALDAIDAIEASGPVSYLIEAQAAAGPELLVGGIRDPSFGPTVALSLGGVDVELLGNAVLRLAPLSPGDAAAMVDSLPQALLDGHRGAAALDRRGLAGIILAVSRILMTSPAVSQIDLNPVRMTEDGLVLLDALVLCG
jgi:acetate---CoA ligase (ADP-forming)